VRDGPDAARTPAKLPSDRRDITGGRADGGRRSPGRRIPILPVAVTGPGRAEPIPAASRVHDRRFGARSGCWSACCTDDHSREYHGIAVRRATTFPAAFGPMMT